MTARLANIQIPVHIDIGFGDAITPNAVEITFPPLLDAPPPELLAYPKETVVAEKFEAMVSLGQANSRMKDYYDLIALSRLFDFDGAVVRDAMAATFERRGTELPTKRPPGLTKAFASVRDKTIQWSAFVRREPLLLDPGDLAKVVQDVGLFVMGPAKAAAAGTPFTHKWKAGSGRWRPKRNAAKKTPTKKTNRRPSRSAASGGRLADAKA